MQTIFAVGEGDKQYLVNPYLDFEAESDAVTIIGSRRNPPLPFPDSGMLLFGSLVGCFENLSDTKPTSSTHERLSRVLLLAL